MVSQMADAKNLGELCMAHVENLHNIPSINVLKQSIVVKSVKSFCRSVP